MKIFVVLCCCLLVLFLVPSIFASGIQVFYWDISGSGVAGSGMLVGDEISPNVFGVMSMGGNFSDTNNGISGDVSNSFGFDSGGGTLTSPDGLYYYDNLLMLDPGGLLLTSTGGILFDVAGGVSSLGGAEVNIAGISGGYQMWETKNGGGYLPPGIWPGYDVEFRVSADPLTPVPEPTTIFMLGGGLVGLVVLRRRQVAKGDGW